METVVLLAVTALGAVGVLLMLPRERVTLVRIGGLVAAFALAGLFLFLVRQMSSAEETAGGPPICFYLFAGIMIVGSVGVICHPRPVYAALYFVLVTLAGAALFVLVSATFMAVVLIIVYAGAILVTYVFVLMLASQAQGTSVTALSPEYDRFASGPTTAVMVSFIFLGTVLQVMYPRANSEITTRNPAVEEPMLVASMSQPPSNTAGSAVAYTPSNVQVLGSTLYGKYAFSLELAGVLLTVALVGAVVISRKNLPEHPVLGSGAVPAE